MHKPSDIRHSSPCTGHATAPFPSLTDGSLAQITHPTAPCHPPIVVFAIKKRKHRTKKILPRRKIARYTGRNCPRERTLITTGWRGQGVGLHLEMRRTSSGRSQWSGRWFFLALGEIFFFSVMFDPGRYVPWTVADSLSYIQGPFQK